MIRRRGGDFTETYDKSQTPSRDKTAPFPDAISCNPSTTTSHVGGPTLACSEKPQSLFMAALDGMRGAR